MPIIRLQSTQRFAHNLFYAEIPAYAHLHANTFARRCLLDAFFYQTYMLFHRGAFNHDCFYAEVSLYRETFTQKRLFTHRTFTERRRAI